MPSEPNAEKEAIALLMEACVADDLGDIAAANAFVIEALNVMDPLIEAQREAPLTIDGIEG